MDVDDEEDLVPEITKAHFEEAMKFARRLVIYSWLFVWYWFHLKSQLDTDRVNDDGISVHVCNNRCNPAQVCVGQRHQEVRDVLADPSAEPWLRQQLQVCWKFLKYISVFRNSSFSGLNKPAFNSCMVLTFKMACRFPDGSTGGNAPAGGSGQVSLEKYH